MFAPQTNPASPAVLKTVKNLFSLCLSRMFTIASQAFPSLPIFLRRQFNWTSLVRLSESMRLGWVNDRNQLNTKLS